jgi:hypothetical protein
MILLKLFRTNVESCMHQRKNFEIGQFLHLKSEIRNCELGAMPPGLWASPICHFGFRI